jgi:hypothetical protein
MKEKIMALDLVEGSVFSNLYRPDFDYGIGLLLL